MRAVGRNGTFARSVARARRRAWSHGTLRRTPASSLPGRAGAHRRSQRRHFAHPGVPPSQSGAGQGGTHPPLPGDHRGVLSRGRAPVPVGPGESGRCGRGLPRVARGTDHAPGRGGGTADHRLRDAHRLESRGTRRGNGRSPGCAGEPRPEASRPLRLQATPRPRLPGASPAGASACWIRARAARR